MKIFKKFASAIMVVCMLLTLCACHGKNEVALTIEGMDIASALYLNALVDADANAKQTVDEQLAKEDSESSEATDYYTQQINGVNFVDYVKEKTIERCKEYVFFQKLVDAGTIKLTDEQLRDVQAAASQYWSDYGYAYLYAANGVSYETYEKAFTYSYYSNEYFEYLYGKDGEKEVPENTLKDSFLENYTLVYALSASYEEKATDDQKAALKTKLEGYEKRLKNGEDFEKIYMEHNGLKEEDHKHQETKDGPKDQHATVLADKNSKSSYAHTDFDELYEMKVGETIIIENAEKTGLTLYVRLDINSDTYYFEQLKSEVLYLLKNEEYQDFVTEKTKNYAVDKNNFAINRFDVEDIDYSALESAYAAQQNYQ